MHHKTLNGWMKHWDFMLLDLLCIIFALVLASYLKFQSLIFIRYSIYQNILLFLLLSDACFCAMGSPYKGILGRGNYEELIQIFKHTVFLILVGILYQYFVCGTFYRTRRQLVIAGLLYAFSSFVIRTLWKQKIQRKKHTIGRKRIILVVTMECAERLLKRFAKKNFGEYEIFGIALIEEKTDEIRTKIKEIPVVCTLNTLPEYISNEWVDGVFFAAGKYIINDDILEKLETMGVTIHQQLPLRYGMQNHRIVENIAGIPCLTSSMTYVNTFEVFEKRCLDIIGGIVGCLITVILTIVLGPVIYMKSPGPIFFTQIRVGRNGKKFKIYKFRSMYMDAEARKQELMEQNNLETDLMFKMEDDPRIIGGNKGIGGFIRKYSLDEFPQFFNVLLGNMSLVGTRPPTVDEWDNYELHHRARMSTKPGITGIWQTSGRNNITDFEEVVRMDTEYINSWSLGLDIKIIFKTVISVLKKEGSM